MRYRQAVVRSLAWMLIVAAAGAGCGTKPPYRVSEPPPPTAAQLKSLGRIELAGSASGTRPEPSPPRVWIGVPDRRAEGAAFGAGVGAIAGAIAGALIAGSGGSGWAQIESQEGAAVGALVGAPVGAVIGALLTQPSAGTRAAAAELRRHAKAIDVRSLARDSASRSPKLAAYREPGLDGGPGATLAVEVVAYGTRAAGGGRATPFVAVRTRLAENGTGRMVYQSTSEQLGSERPFSQWAQGGAVEFRRELEDAARELGTRSVDRALTPRPN